MSTLWRPCQPIPEDAPPTPQEHPKLGPPARTWPILDDQNRVLGWCFFWESPEKSKSILPCTLWHGPGGSLEWRWLRPAPTVSDKVRKIVEGFLPAVEAEYTKEGDPYLVWLAYLFARGSNIAIPEWVLRYFDQALAYLVNGAVSGSFKDHLADAFDMKMERGKRGPASKAATQTRRERAMELMKEYIAAGISVKESAVKVESDLDKEGFKPVKYTTIINKWWYTQSLPE